MPERRYLDDVLLSQRVLAHQARDSLRTLATDTALPGPLRTTAAALAVCLGKFSRALDRLARTRQP